MPCWAIYPPGQRGTAPVPLSARRCRLAVAALSPPYWMTQSWTTLARRVGHSAINAGRPSMSTGTDLPTPDFTFDANAPGACIAGVRPYRAGSYRLDAETASGRFLVHDYGHGGAGITLSWGCAARVRDLVAEHLTTSRATRAAVLGAGVMGLTAATRLLDLGLAVT